MSARASAAFLLLVGACAAPVFPSAPEIVQPPASPASQRAPFDVQDAARALARFRGLTLREPIRVEELEADAFRERLLRPRTTQPRAATSSDAHAFWGGLGFASANANVDAIVKDVYGEQVAGLYDSESKLLVLRKGVAGLDSNRGALMHEIEHALQDQMFGMPDPTAARDDDAALALRSLYEGDATLTSIAFNGNPLDAPSRPWLVRRARRVRETPLETFIEQGGAESKALAAAPPLVRVRLMSPYLDGMTFVGDVFRAGGFALVNQVFAHPPVSTEQVLHPSKYVAGELPIPVNTPVPPNGHRAVAHGRMGELQIGVFLAQCMPALDAKRAATGWGGDAYAVVSDSAQRQGVLLATAWDDEEAATRFATALEGRRACLAKRGSALADTIAVRRDKTRVAYVDGIDVSAREAALVSLLSLPGSPPALAPPIGAVSIPLDALPEDYLGKGTTDDTGKFESKPLGVSFVVPHGAGIDPDKGVELRFQTGKPSSIHGMFRFVLAAPSQDVEADALRATTESMKRSAPNVVLKDDGVRDVTYAFGVARVHRWSVGDRFYLLTAVAPACGGSGSLEFVATSWDAAGISAIERWLASVSVRPSDATVCPYLGDPRR